MQIVCASVKRMKWMQIIAKFYFHIKYGSYSDKNTQKNSKHGMVSGSEVGSSELRYLAHFTFYLWK